VKHVVSVSIGSSERNHRVDLNINGCPFIIERIGTDGDLQRAIELIRELDGKVDAIGMGGIDLYIYAGGKRYTFRDAQRMARAAAKTPIVDGSGLKNSLERWVVDYLVDELKIELKGKRVLMASAVDRFGMAESFARHGCRMTFGDLCFALGVPIGIHSLNTLRIIAMLLLPLITRLPFTMLYPTGDKQHQITPKYRKYYDWADIIAGDWHYIRRYMPDSLPNKIILTNTVTPQNVEELRRRGAAMLITTTPNLLGRSFGTNVIEAALVCLAARSPDEIKPEDYMQLLKEFNFRPRVEVLNPA